VSNFFPGLATADILLWALAVGVALTFFSKIVIRRRTLYTETLQSYVKRCRSGESQ